MSTNLRSRPRRPFTAPLVLAALVAGTSLLAVPSAAQAAEGVSSRYSVGCSIFTTDNGRGESVEPAGVSFDGVRSSASASPAQRTLSASSTSVLPADAPLSGEDCDVSARFTDRVTVGAGSTGLEAGATVPVQVTVRLDADVLETWDVDESFTVGAEYDTDATIRSLDGCAEDGEVPVCDTPLQFEARHRHEVYGSSPNGFNGDGYVQASAFRSHSLSTNVEGGGSETYVDESRPGQDDGTDICGTWAGCIPAQLHDPQGPEVYTAPATLVVGNRYDITGVGRLVTRAYDNAGVQATASIRELSVSITPATGFEGVDLAYASAADVPPSEEPQDPPADETAPTVTATATPDAVDGWHTGPVTVTLSASDTGSGVQSISYATTGAVTTDETVVTGNTTEVSIATDGVTDVTYTATDVAGNVSQPQTLTVRIDTAPPTLDGLADVTVQALDASGAVVTYSVTAQDTLTPNPTVTCQPPSGSQFPVGDTTVTCTAVDAAGNTASGDFTVTVTPPSSALDRLGEAIGALGVRKAGVKIALTHLLRGIEERFEMGQTQVGCIGLTTMDGFVTVLWFTGQVTTAQAETLQGLIREAQVEKGC